MAQGKKTGGRRKGVPNKVTTVARQAFLATFGKLEGDLEAWIRKTAEGTEVPLKIGGNVLLGPDGNPLTFIDGADPAKAADLVIRMAEYHFPKLGRTEVAGDQDKPIRVKFGLD